MAMLRPKHVLPLYKGARAVFVSGASHGSPWSNSLDQGPSAGIGSSLPDDSKPERQLSEASLPNGRIAPASRPFDREIAPPSRTIAALGVLGPVGFSQSPPCLPVAEQLFKQGTVIPTAKGAAFLPELARQLHLGEGASLHNHIPTSGKRSLEGSLDPSSVKPSLTQAGKIEALAQSRVGSKIAAGSVQSPLNLHVPQVLHSSNEQTARARLGESEDRSGRAESANPVRPSGVHVVLPEPTSHCKSIPAPSSNLSLHTTPCLEPKVDPPAEQGVSGGSTGPPGFSPGAILIGARNSGSSAAAVSSSAPSSSLIPQGTNGLAVVFPREEPGLSRPVRPAGRASPGPSAGGLADLGSSTGSEGPGLAFGNGASLAPESADLVGQPGLIWANPGVPLGNRYEPNLEPGNAAQLVASRGMAGYDSGKSGRGILGSPSGGPSVRAGESPNGHRTRRAGNHRSEKRAAAETISDGRDFDRSGEKNPQSLDRYGGPGPSSRGMAYATPKGSARGGRLPGGRMRGPMQRLQGDRNMEGGGAHSPRQTQPFHAVGELRRSRTHAEVVGEVCEVLRKMSHHAAPMGTATTLRGRGLVGLPDTSHPVARKQDTLSAVDLHTALQEWQGSINQYHACDILKRQDDPQVAMAFFHWAQQQPHYKADTYVYTTLIGVMGKAKDTRAVSALMAEMQRLGCKPSVVTYNRLMHSYGRSNMLKEALAVREEMEQAGVPADYFTYSTLVDVYIKAGLHSKAVETYSAMKAMGFTPDSVVLTMLMNSYGRMGELPKAVQMFREMVASGKTANVVSWNTIIDLHSKAGKDQMALQLYHDMLAAGQKPDVLTYSTMITIFGKGAQYAQAEELFNQMLEEGHTPDAIAWSTLVQIWGKAGQPMRAAKWFRQMLQAGVTPTVPCFNTLIYVFLRAGMFSEARLVFEAMQKRGHQSTINTYTLLLSACTQCADQEGVNMLLDLMQASGHPVHGMLKVLLRGPTGGEEALWQEVRALWDGINHEGLEDRRALADALINFLTKYGFKARAAGLWMEVRSRNVWATAMRDRDQSGNNKWQLDLHSMSAGTAKVVVQAELMRLRAKSITAPQESFPCELEIITGWGRRSRVSGSSNLKASVMEMLQRMGSPLLEDRTNLGRLAADGEATREWLLQDEVGEALKLEDVFL